MKQMLIMILAALVLHCALAAAESDVPKSNKEANSAWSEGGLVKVQVKGLDAVYARPGASLGEYRKVLLRPVSVSFRRDWDKRAQTGSHIRIRAEDSQRIRDKLSALVREQLGKELTAGGYELTDSVGDDVLEVEMAIVDLYVTAPNVPGSSRTDTLALSAGEMSLVAQLNDSVTGDVIMRVFDRSSARESTWARRITSVDNAAEAKQITGAWAQALRKELDAAKTVPASH